MRFCPYCSAQNALDAEACAACGRKLPPAPGRRAARVSGVSTPSSTGVVEANEVTEISEGTLTAGLTAAAVAIPSPQASPVAVTTPMLAPANATTVPVRTTAPAPVVAPSSIAAALQRATGEQPAVGAYVPSTPLPRASLSADRRPAPASQPPPVGAPGRRREDSGPPPVPPTRAITIPPPLPSGPPTPLPMAAAVVPVDGPPPTVHIQTEGLVDRPYTPARVAAVPELPDGGLGRAAMYAVRFARARWQRRGAIRQLGKEITLDTTALDAVLGALGRAARNPRVTHKAFVTEHAAIDAAEGRRGATQHTSAELDRRRGDEDRRFAELEVERGGKVSDAERELADAHKAREHVEGQRRSLRERRKDIDRRQHAYYKAADDRESEASPLAMGPARDELRRAAEGHRREAQEMDAEKREIDGKLAGLEEPFQVAQAAVDAAKDVLEVARQALSDVRAGHAQRLTELDDEQKRKASELAHADGEIARRLVTLGTLVNLNRVDGPQFADLYARIDRIRTAIGARTTEIDRLTAERAAYDRSTLVRGVATLVGAVVALILVLVVLRKLL